MVKTEVVSLFIGVDVWEEDSASNLEEVSMPVDKKLVELSEIDDGVERS